MRTIFWCAGAYGAVRFFLTEDAVTMFLYWLIFVMSCVAIAFKEEID